MTIQFPDLAARMKAKQSLAATDIMAFRKAAWPDGKIDPAEAEAMFDLNHQVASTDPAWTDFFVEALTTYIVDQRRPRGYVDDANAEWLIAQVDRDGKLETRAELELLVMVIERATSVPERLKTYTLAQIERAVISGWGPTRNGGTLEPNCVNATEAALLRRVIFASGGDGPAIVSRAEADMLFRIKDVALGAPNAPEWETLFVQGVGNHLMAHSSYRPLATDVAVRLETFMDDATPDLSRFIGRMARSGLTGFAHFFGSHAPARDRDAEVAAANAILPEEREWLNERLAAQEGIDAHEAALLKFVAEESGGAE